MSDSTLRGLRKQVIEFQRGREFDYPADESLTSADINKLVMQSDDDTAVVYALYAGIAAGKPLGKLVGLDGDVARIREASGETIVSSEVLPKGTVVSGTDDGQIKEANLETDYIVGVTAAPTEIGAEVMLDYAPLEFGTFADSPLEAKTAKQYIDSIAANAINSGTLGAANGVATLDGSGKIPSSQLTVDAMQYKGNWNASTNSPALADGTGSSGDIYRVSVAATRNLGSGSITWNVDDEARYNGTTWELATTSSLAVTQVKYVNKSGNDTTGDGSLARPFLTISAAQAAITDATALKIYTIYVGPGTYASYTPKDFCWIVGAGAGTANHVTTISNAVTYVPGNVAGGTNCYHFNVSFSSTFTLNRSLAGYVVSSSSAVTTSHTLGLINCFMSGAVTYNGAGLFSQVGGDAYDFTGTEFNAALTVNCVASSPISTRCRLASHTLTNQPMSGAFTVTIASPGVFTSANAPSLANGVGIVIQTTGALPTGLTPGNVYYVVNYGTDGATSFRLSATVGGSAINTSGTQSGTHTWNAPIDFGTIVSATALTGAMTITTQAGKTWNPTGGILQCQQYDYQHTPPAWDSGYSYPANQIISYSGSFYRALIANSGNQPDTSPTQWAVSYQHVLAAWSSSVAYQTGEYATYGGNTYVVVQASNTNHQPDTNPQWWKQVVLPTPPAWNSAINYRVGDTVTSGGNTYVSTAAGANHVPPNASFWTQITPIAIPFTGFISSLLAYVAYSAYNPATGALTVTGTTFALGSAIQAGQGLSNCSGGSSTMDNCGWANPGSSITMTMSALGQRAGMGGALSLRSCQPCSITLNGIRCQLSTNGLTGNIIPLSGALPATYWGFSAANVNAGTNTNVVSMAYIPASPGNWSTAPVGAQDAFDRLAATRELTANKDTDTTLAANSDTKYPSQKAIKTYADNQLALKANRSEFVYAADGALAPGDIGKLVMDDGSETAKVYMDAPATPASIEVTINEHSIATSTIAIVDTLTGVIFDLTSGDDWTEGTNSDEDATNILAAALPYLTTAGWTGSRIGSVLTFTNTVAAADPVYLSSPGALSGEWATTSATDNGSDAMADSIPLGKLVSYAGGLAIVSPSNSSTLIASGSIAKGDYVTPADDGKVSTLAEEDLGLVFCAGVALNAAADGESVKLGYAPLYPNNWTYSPDATAPKSIEEAIEFLKNRTISERGGNIFAGGLVIDSTSSDFANLKLIGNSYTNSQKLIEIQDSYNSYATTFSISQNGNVDFHGQPLTNAGFNASTPGDWAGSSPTTIQAAIDRLAAAVAALNEAPIP